MTTSGSAATSEPSLAIVLVIDEVLLELVEDEADVAVEDRAPVLDHVGEARTGRRIGRRRGDQRAHRFPDRLGEPVDRIVGPRGEDDTGEVGTAAEGTPKAELPHTTDDSRTQERALADTARAVEHGQS